MRFQRFQKLALACTLVTGACGEAEMSLGRVPCRPEDAACADARGAVIHPIAAPLDFRAGRAIRVWSSALQPTCSKSECDTRLPTLVLHDEGDVTVVALTQATTSEPSVWETRLWVGRFDADGQRLWERDDFPLRAADEGSPSPGCAADRRSLCGSFFAVALHAQAGPGTVGNVQIWLARNASANSLNGKLHAFTVDATGELVASLQVPLEGVPGVITPIERGVLIPGLDSEGKPLLARYDGAGQRVWQRRAFIELPSAADGFRRVVHPARRPTLLQIGVDAEARIWALLHDGGYGLMQLEGSGGVAFQGWTESMAGPLPAAATSGGLDGFGYLTPHVEPVFDQRGRALVGASGLGILRLESEPAGAVAPPLLATLDHEQFYPPDVLGLAVDGDDRAYVATREGPRSALRLRIDRISSDFSQGESFVLDLDAQDEARPMAFAGLRVSTGGAVHVLTRSGVLDPQVSGLVGLAQPETAGLVSLMRLHLEDLEPVP